MNHKTHFILRYLFVALLGVLLHFVYEWSGKNLIVGLFSPINESVWEHLKLFFFPMLLLTLWDLFTSCRNNISFLPARTSCILSGVAFIVIAFYTVTGVIGTNIDWINIFIYLLSVAFAFWVEKKLYSQKQWLNTTVSTIILTVLVISFVVFTLKPPALGIFIPPVS